jgi:hypothetical protein
MYEASYNNYRSLIEHSDKYKDLDEQHIDALHTRTWIAVTGLAVLSISGIMNPTEAQLISTIETVIDRVKANPDPIHVD